MWLLTRVSTANTKYFELYEIIEKSHENIMNIINYYFVFYVDLRHYEKIMLCDIKINWTLCLLVSGDSLGVRFNNGNTTWVVIQNHDNYMWVVSLEELSSQLRCWVVKHVGSVYDRFVSTVVVNRIYVVLKLIAFWTVFYPLLQIIKCRYIFYIQTNVWVFFSCG